MRRRSLDQGAVEGIRNAAGKAAQPIAVLECKLPRADVHVGVRKTAKRARMPAPILQKPVN
ncbi:MAG: hypothetical protein ACRERZ_02125 [Gammaproteobacteria bacterium]